MSIRKLIVIGVYKRFNSSTKSKNHPRAKKHWYVFYYNDDFELKTKRIHWFEVLYYKIKVKKRKQFYCFKCGLKFTAFVNRFLCTKFVHCPNGCDG